MPSLSVDAILPGAQQPYPPCSAARLARFLHVPAARIHTWVDGGLVCSADGLIDPFAAVNWISWGHLEECAVLARRWKTYLSWFAPFVAGQEKPRTITWLRRHRLYLPHPVEQLEWFLPGPAEDARQRLLGVQPVQGEGFSSTAVAGGDRLVALQMQHATVQGTAEVLVLPQAPLSPHDADGSHLIGLLRTVAGEFHYAYRRHEVGEYPRMQEGMVDARWQGSCIDCVMALGSLLTQHGRQWRLCAGVVARTAIANPHFWLETPVRNAWIVLDPTLPAIVRMLGGDWRGYVQAYAGGCDARRVAIRLDGHLAEVPGGMSLLGSGGEAVATNRDGRRRNALPCSDWICGECTHQFDSRAHP